MNNRLFAILIVACLALAGSGCASRAKRHRPAQRHRQAQRDRQEVLLPRQTGSNLDRRITVDDESSFKKPIQPESKPPSKKRVKTERTVPEKAKEPKPDQPEETTPPPDRFR
jgi:hypothetical protein